MIQFTSLRTRRAILVSWLTSWTYPIAPVTSVKTPQRSTKEGDGALTRNVNPWCINCGNVSVGIDVHVPQEEVLPRTTAPSYISNSARDISISSRMVADPPGLPSRVTSATQYFSSSMPLIETCREG